ncbi:MAG TPA: peroxiredoxin [Candidatus Limnocylindria bacterium]|nr:peroxiredoxin [Candidatus Limnocylindria bacterium]
MKKILLPFVSLFAAVIAMGSALAAETPKVGDKAPLIEAQDQDGKTWKLADQVGKKAVILYFYPKDDTAGCTKEACGFRDRLDQLDQLGVAVVGVSRDDAESHKKFREKNHLTFPLLVDTSGKLTDAYGAATPDNTKSRRVSFLIDRDGKIVHVTDMRDALVHLTELKEAVDKLKK